MSLPKVFLTRRLPNAVMKRLDVESELLLPADLDAGATREELLDAVTKVDGLICLLSDRIDEEVFRAGSGLKVVSNYAVGYNNIDVALASKHGVVVTNTPDVLTACTADMAMSLLLATARRVVEGDELVRQGDWQGWGPMQLLGTEVTGATIGFVGFGRIAQATMRRAAAFDMRCLYWNRTRLSEADERSLNVTYVPLDQLLPQCDFVSVHVALCDETKHLINRERLQSMKPSAILINTARGAVVDEAALVEALQAGWIGGAGLDVYEQEPAIHPGLPALKQTVLAPHLGSATMQTRTKMGELAVENCLAVCRGQQPPNPVNGS